MSDPFIAAKPKTVGGGGAAPGRSDVQVSVLPNQDVAIEKRGPGRPPKPDAMKAMLQIAKLLGSLDRDARIDILQTLLELVD